MSGIHYSSCNADDSVTGLARVGGQWLRYFLLAVTAYLILIPCQGFAALKTPLHSSLQLSSSTDRSLEGFLTLAWSGQSSEQPASLELALDDRFIKMVRTVPLNSQVLEKGQVHISGLRDGAYSARLVSESYEPLSNVIAFNVQHRDLSTALWIFAVGALLFVALVVVVIRFSTEER